jgi:hypothetical protein
MEWLGSDILPRFNIDEVRDQPSQFEAAKPVRVLRKGECDLAGVLDAEPRQFIMLIRRRIDGFANPRGYLIQVQHKGVLGAGDGHIDVPERTPGGRSDADLLLKLPNQRLFV